MEKSMKRISVRKGIKYLPSQYREEDELKSIFKEHVGIIFGNNSIFFEGAKIKSNSGIGSIPDGFVLLLEDEKWFLIEVELVAHPLYDHIVSQISKFNIAIKNHENKNKLIDAFYEELNSSPLKDRIGSLGIKKELYKVLTDIINKNPKVVIIIDKKTGEVVEACDSLPFPSEILEFKTYYGEGEAYGDSIYSFDTLDVEKPQVREETTKRHLYGAARFEQVLEVVELVLLKGKSYNEAAKDVANRKKITVNAVYDKCIRQLNMTTKQFKELLRNRDRIIKFLYERFPDEKDKIDNLLKK